jgi:hypothetical protein
MHGKEVCSYVDSEQTLSYRGNSLTVLPTYFLGFRQALLGVCMTYQ